MYFNVTPLLENWSLSEFQVFRTDSAIWDKDITHIEQVRHLYCFKSRVDNKYTRPYKKAAKYFNNATVDVGISLDKVLKVGLDSSCLQNNTSLDYFLEQ